MADQPIINGNGNMKTSVFNKIKDVTIVVGLIIAMAAFFGWFGEVKTDIAVIKTEIKFIQTNMTTLQTNLAAHSNGGRP